MEPGDTTGGQTANSDHTGNCAIISKMVSTYIKTSTPADATTLVNIDDVKRKPFANQLLPSDLIYNLSDVEKFLPKIEENANVEDFCGETLTRKRKERQDSGSFSAHECKVTRSNSEERSVEVRIVSEDNIRRVSSHEDFERYKKPVGRTQAQTASSNAQSSDDNHLPLRAHNRLETSSDSVHVKDINKSAMIGEKFSRFSVQDLDNENSLEYYNVRQKYSKNDSSPSRSSIHEYILFPKKISPNRDPNAFGRAQLCEPAGAGGGAWEMESEAAEKARSSERRSRTRRAPPRRQPKHLLSGATATSGSLKENDLIPGRDGANENSSRKSKRSGRNPNHRDSSSSIMHDSQNNISSVNKSKGNYERIYDEEDPKHFNPEKEIGQTKHHFKNTTSKIENAKKMRDRSQSPSVHSQSPARKTPFIDLKILHEQLGNDVPVPSVPVKFSDFPNDSESFENLYNFHDDSEPLLDDNIAGYSKEISEIQNQKRILPDKCDYGSIEALGGNLVIEDERLNKISKKIQTLKKKIAKCEVDFELLHGYRASHADKMNDSTLRKLYAEIRKLKYEKKSIKKGPSESILRAIPTISPDEQSLKTKPIADVVLEIERRLEAKRSAHGRPEQLEKCSRAQLVDEKAAVQRALLWLEGARGRPSSRPDRDTARPLYDRYRVVKRLVASFDAMKLNCSNELATIMENEALPFTSSDSPEESPESMDKESNSDADNKDSSSENKEIDEGASSSAKSTASDQAVLLVEEKRDVINENLHILPLHELNKLLLEAKGVKLSLRATIKTMEANYEDLNGRSLTGDDKELILQTYAKYKETKARIRLLTALVNKQKKM